MLKLAGEVIEGQLADHQVELDAHTRDAEEIIKPGQYDLGGYHSTFSTIAVAADRIHAIPFHVSRKRTYQYAAIYVTVAGSAGKKARLGIYADDGTILPGALIEDWGEVAIDSTGLKVIDITDRQLDKGLYWVVMHTEDTFTLRSRTASSFSPLGVRSTGGAALGGVEGGYIKDTAYAALPDPLTGLAALSSLPFINIALNVKSND